MKKRTIIIVACLIILSLGVGITVAYIVANTNSVKNQFIPAEVTCEVEEEFQNGLKTDVVVRNTGNVNAYIRATVVVNWMSADGKIHSSKPVENTDYTIRFADVGWIKGDDGFWYHTQIVSPKDVTTELIKNAQYVSGAPDGYTLGVNIIATAIQAEPDTAVKEAWSVDVQNGVLIP